MQVVKPGYAASKKEARVIEKTIKHWQQLGVVSTAEAAQLRASYTVREFDWQRIAKYALWLAILCIIISFSALIADAWFKALLRQFFATPWAGVMMFASIATALYYRATNRKRRYPEKIYSNEALFFLGVVATAAAIGCLETAVALKAEYFSLLPLAAALTYGVIGIYLGSKLVWLFALFSLAGWLGAVTGYLATGAYFLGMNYPLRFVVLGLVLIIISGRLVALGQHNIDLSRVTRAVGLLYLFIALWLLSIFGNYGSLAAWQQTKQLELLHWSLLFGVAALGSIAHGVKYDDQMTRGFGLSFIFINLYTRFFEYFWHSMHKTIFFALLAVSFWYLGTKAEVIWRLRLEKESAAL